ncbi:PREDICTED: uncharacterized protein LOC105818832 isoform X2 [Propithecus coquereli]|uniref:uncharacterized protein LOC105818832 isoform X2 n=1 Tax=Propithecus coquereli TaxID=379532 RepID=UPI00063EE20A|nr:PREDICTED: uncharacterized protein LOC105818832 isoform X2 [Propithecus coquereli]
MSADSSPRGPCEKEAWVPQESHALPEGRAGGECHSLTWSPRAQGWRSANVTLWGDRSWRPSPTPPPAPSPNSSGTFQLHSPVPRRLPPLGAVIWPQEPALNVCSLHPRHGTPGRQGRPSVRLCSAWAMAGKDAGVCGGLGWLSDDFEELASLQAPPSSWHQLRGFLPPRSSGATRPRVPAGPLAQRLSSK